MSFGKKAGEIFRVIRGKWWITVRSEDNGRVSVVDGPITPDLILYWKDYIQMDPSKPIFEMMPENMLIEKGFSLYSPRPFVPKSASNAQESATA
jgi:hypothetical protein